MNILGIIPARFDSTRFPGKPLVDIAGKSMIQRVYQRALLSSVLSHVVVATDDHRIVDHVRNFGGIAMLTSAHHQSGTDRCAEVAAQYKEADIVINIQGDEPFIHPEQIDLLACCFQKEETQIATLVNKISNAKELFNFNIPKVVIDNFGNALYFSRNAIPFQRDVQVDQWLENGEYFKHIGIYGFRKAALMEVTTLSSSKLEKSEALEQLRWLENGFKIQVAKTIHQSHGVDHPEDIQTVLREYKHLL